MRPAGLLLAAAGLAVAVADLPVHCLRHQVGGTWTFHLGAPSDKRTDCGHKHPDREEAQPATRIVGVPVKNLTVQLHEPNEAVAGGARGTWTMIYDEGFEVDVMGLEFFAFSKFQLLPAQMRSFGGQTAILSECGKTQVGWYRDVAKNQWGCYHGRRQTIESAMTQLERTVQVTPTTRSYTAALSQSELEAVAGDLNSRRSSWTAKAYRRFVGKSLKQLNVFAGLQRSAGPEPPRRFAGLQRGSRQLRGQQGDEAWRKQFPQEWDWRNVNGSSWLTEPIDQGDCGSCYVISTMRMLTARHRIAKRDPKAEPFSIDFPLHCSEYNQGCKGGYPFLVSKWSRDVGVLPESCGHYNTEQNTCAVTCDASKVQRFRAKSFSYVGGYYGAGSEQGMMQELLTNGPVVVSLEPAHDFMYYSSGIYRSSPAKHAEWVKVDHSVLLVGWGEAKDARGGDPQRYWVVQNSWGADWGEAGFFRIDRGDNDSGIESEALSGDVSEEPAPLEMSFVKQM